MTDDNRAATAAAPASVSGVRPAALAVLRYGAMLFAAAVVVQFYLAGSGIFAATGPVKDASSLDPHRTLGNILAGVALLLVIAMIIARPARRLVLTVVVLFVLTGVEGLLAGAGSGSPYVGALHPVVAAVILGAALGVVFQTRRGSH
ncbi:MAG TPA: DUF6220 domain-containing protein [Pseudonocardiaceae bacterium]|jgi:hypothetical protein|nr:DUF6220 domain-containing protein [Pseudonocardiaceae bacterium]